MYWCIVYRMESLPNFIDLEHMFFFMGDSDYYAEVEAINNNKDAVKEVSKSMTREKLFNWSIKYGFCRLCVYMYVICNQFYTKTDLEQTDGLNIGQIETSKNGSDFAAVQSSAGGNERVTIQGWDKDSVAKQKVIRCLYQLRRYSKYQHVPSRGYGWQFNNKYMQNFDFVDFAERYIPIVKIT